MIRRTVVLAAFASILPAVAAAQKTTVVRGKVIATNGDPIPRAEVFFSGLDVRAITGDDGSFFLEAVRVGKYWMNARRIGYVPVSVSITLEPGKPRNFKFELDPLPANLSPVEVRASSGYGTGRMAEFGRRSRVAWGHFVTRDDIERQRPVRLSWVVQRYLPWVRHDAFDHPMFNTAMLGSGRRSSAFGQSSCAPAISLNGGTPWGGYAVNDFQPSDVEALEVYAGRSTRIPMEFQGSPHTQCGLVVIWLR